MISTFKAKEIAREIASIEASGTNESIVVSISLNQQEAIWGDVVALTESDMQDAMEAAGYSRDSIESMMTAEDFRAYYADCID